MFQVTGAFAEFERSMISVELNAGLRRAVEQGKQLGRPKIAPRPRKANPKSFADRDGHSGRCQEMRCRYGHRAAYCAGDEQSPFRRRKRASRGRGQI